MAKIRIRKRGKTYSYSFDTSKKPRRMKEKGGFATEQEAFDAGTAAYAAWKTGNVGITSAKVTLDEFVASWLENVVKGNTRPRTYAAYKQRYKGHIQPYIGAVPLQDIHPRDIDRLAHVLADKGYSHQTIQGILGVAHSIFSYAVYPSELLQTNPATYIKIPKSAPKSVVKRTIISSELFNKILTTYPIGNSIRIIVVIAYYTGMRIGEILGLTWDDISFDNGTISLVRQLRIKEASNSSLCFGPLKTEASKRIIYIGDTLISEMRQWKAIQTKNRLKLGGAYQIAYELPEDGKLMYLPKKDSPPLDAIERPLVCTDYFGVDICRCKVQYHLEKFGLNSHSFRHTHATKLIEAGAKPIDVAARLGHANVSITQNIYAHNTEAMQRETAALTDKVL